MVYALLTYFSFMLRAMCEIGIQNRFYLTRYFVEFCLDCKMKINAKRTKRREYIMYNYIL